MPDKTPASILQYLIRYPAPAPNSSFLLIQTPGDSSGGSGSQVSTTNMGDSDEVHGSQLQSSQEYFKREAVDGISFCLSNKKNHLKFAKAQLNDLIYIQRLIS